MPQNDFVDPADPTDPPDPLFNVEMWKRQNLLISDEVQKDIEHSAQQHVHGSAQHGHETDTNSQSVQTESVNNRVEDSSSFSNSNSFNAQSPGNERHVVPRRPAVKPSRYDNASAAATMEMTPIPGTHLDEATMATNYGQVPVGNDGLADVLNYEYPHAAVQARGILLENQGTTSGNNGPPAKDEIAEDVNKNIWERRESIAMADTEDNEFQLDDASKPTGLVDPVPKTEITVKHEDLKPPKRDIVPAVESIPPPIKDSRWTKVGPTKEALPPLKEPNDNRYTPTPLFKPRNAFRRMYFSRKTPDLRFKRDVAPPEAHGAPRAGGASARRRRRARRDLTRLARTTLRTTDHLTLHLHRVRLEDEAMYECQVKPLGGPARWGRAQLNVHGESRLRSGTETHRTLFCIDVTDVWLQTRVFYQQI